MAEEDTRARILRVALREFAARGFHATSVRELAELVGVTKTAVLYHFPGKNDILAALAEPMLDDLHAAMDVAERSEPATWVAIEGLVDVFLEHRYLLHVNLNDLALASPGPIFDRFRDGMLRANRLVAGPKPDLARRVRAAQAVAMLSDPVVLFPDEPVETVRALVLDGVRRLLGGPPAKSGRRQRGRPAAMSADMAETARRMRRSGSTGAEIAATLGVSRATVYRHLD